MGWVESGTGGTITVHSLDGPFHSGNLQWGQLSKSGSNLNEITTREHSALQSIGFDDHHARYHASTHITGGDDILPEATAITSGLLTPALRRKIFYASNPRRLDLTPLIDGITDTFPVSPRYQPGKLQAFLNGVMLQESQITEVSNTSIQFYRPILSGEDIWVIYLENEDSPYPYITDSDTIALWHLDELYGTTMYDESGNNLDGGIFGAVTVNQTGKFSSCYNFNSGFVQANSIPIGTSSFTIECHVKFSTTAIDQQLVEWGSGPDVGLRFIAPNKIRFYVAGVSGGYFESIISPSTINFKHYAGVYTIGAQQNIKIYEDGVKLYDVNYIDTFTGNGTKSAQIGNGLYGYLDEIRLSSKARSVSEFNF